MEWEAPIAIKKGNVELILLGKNKLKTSYANGIDGGKNKLTVDGTGELVAKVVRHGCGISAQEIVINNGKIKAYADGYGYAAIGTRQRLELKSITINGGNIKAYADVGETYGMGARAASAGIGAGCENCGNITINGGKIESYCGSGPAIGGNKEVESIKITGGDIVAVGGDLSTGIGCGGSVISDVGPVSKIDIQN